MDAAAFLEFFAASIRIATPLLYAALGGLLSERAGTFAVGLEGIGKGVQARRGVLAAEPLTLVDLEQVHTGLLWVRPGVGLFG